MDDFFEGLIELFCCLFNPYALLWILTFVAGVALGAWIW